ncbi:hypothetical protein MKK88_02645 [Methylobacterium sp. E-005]|uniref:hypothetical protein n=1 Tax=Methylobacterium sp. E-005 TaxID=2836549 RepID=UPI001FB862C3|nr:hypothetical protein [Methylobacterium sp. E-005]MCJ2084893.1 hypothetical protein [Methylobacterium sp. E-005]
MVSRTPGRNDKAAADPAIAELHTLTENLSVMQRLLGRRTEDGVLVQADPALVRSAIATGREQVLSIKATLATVAHDPTGPFQQSADKMIAAVDELDGLLDTLEEMLSVAGK